MTPQEAKALFKHTMERVKNLDHHTVIINKMDDWEVYLPAPFDIKVRKDTDTIECRVLAVSHKEATRLVMEHYGFQ